VAHGRQLGAGLKAILLCRRDNKVPPGRHLGAKRKFIQFFRGDS